MTNKKPPKDFEKIIYNHYINQYKEEGDNMYWIMKNGTDIMIKDMADNHLKNTINMLKKKQFNETRSAWIEIFEIEFRIRRKFKIDKMINNIDLDDVLRSEK